MALVHKMSIHALSYRLTSLILGIIGIPLIGLNGVIRGTKPSNFPHPLQGRIITTLARSPGLHFRELQRRLGAANGTLRHRLEKMKSEGEVYSQSTNGRLCYYVGPPAQLEILRGVVVENDAMASSILPVGLSKLQRKIVSLIAKKGSFESQAEMARSLRRSRSAVNSAIMVLRERGIIHPGKIALESHLTCLSNTMPVYDWVGP